MVEQVSKEEKVRIEWIDQIKAICIFFVMYSHIPISKEWIVEYYFFLVGFFFCSGYTFSIDKGVKYRIIRIVDSLVIPYVILSFIMFFPRYGHIVDFVNNPLMTLTDVATNILFGYSSWFVPCLITTELIYAVSLKLKVQDFVVLGGVIIYLVGAINNKALPWHIDTAMYSLFFFHIGYEYKLTHASPIILKNRVALFFLFVFMITSYKLYPVNPFNTSLNEFTNESLTLIMNVIGVCCLLIVSVKLKPSWYSNYLGKNSLLLYYFHIPFVYYIYHFVNHFVSLKSPIIDNSIFGIFYVFTISIVLYPLIKIVTKFDVLSGKGKLLENLLSRK